MKIFVFKTFCIQNKKKFHLQKVTKFFLMAQETQVSTIDSSHRSLFDSINFFYHFVLTEDNASGQRIVWSANLGKMNESSTKLQVVRFDLSRGSNPCSNR